MRRAKAHLVKELEKRLRFETLLADSSARFVNLPADQIDDRIKKFSQTKKEYSAESPYHTHVKGVVYVG